MDGASPSWWEWLGGIAFLAVTGLFGFTHKRIGEVAADLRSDQVEEITSLKNEVARLDRTFNERFKEIAQSRDEMWKTIQANQISQEKQHAQNLEKLNLIPTRDEMMRLLQQFVVRSTH